MTGATRFERVIETFDDPRVELIRPRAIDYFLYKRMKPVGRAATHWMMVVLGIEHARCGHAFLHDADAFFLEADGLERQYRECRDRGFSALGVTARWDPFFAEAGYVIPGTWELMFSTRWARSRSPFALKNGWHSTQHGAFEFDSMHYPMYLRCSLRDDRRHGASPAPRPLQWNDRLLPLFPDGPRKGRRVVPVAPAGDARGSDPVPHGGRVVPTVDELVRGLTDPDQPVSYNSAVAIEQYPIFRRLLDELCTAPIFAGPRADRIRRMIRPFDAHFEPLVAAALADAASDDAEAERESPDPRHGMIENILV